MNKPRLAWAITSSGHYIEECLGFLPTLDDAELTVVALIPMHSLETMSLCQ
ncbi:MAG: hypothetical protein WAW61_00860 [Methylococcaceae bacterium]